MSESKPSSIARQLLKSSTLFGLLTLLSRILGFVRDVVLASVFGSGPAFDAFIIAFKIPNFMRRLFAEGAFSQAFVPILSEYRIRRSPEALRQFIHRIAGTLSATLLLVVLLMEILAPLLILIFAPGFAHDANRYQLAVSMLRITLPYLLLISLVAFSAAVMNAHQRFGISAFTPVLLNVAMIVAAVYFTKIVPLPIYALSWGVLLGGSLQLLFQWPFLKKLGVLPKFEVSFKDSSVRRVIRLMVPALFGVSIAQISLLIDNIFASYLRVGSLSWLYYSDRLTYLPMGIIGVALSTVILPNLSKAYSANSKQQFSVMLDWGLRCLLLIGLPCALGLLALSGPLITTLFHHGVFSAMSVLMTQKSTMAMAIGLPGFMGLKILASAFYSQQDLKTPVRIAAVALVLNIALNFVLVRSLAHAGLALSTAISTTFNALVLLVFLLKQRHYEPSQQWGIYLIRLFVANVVMALFVLMMAGSASQWLHYSQWHQITRLAWIITSAIVIYFSSLYVLGLRPRHFTTPREEA